MKYTIRLSILLYVLSVLASNTASAALVLPNPTLNAYTYGNFYSYSLPILAFKYNVAHSVGTGPGNPYYIDSSAGQIKDNIVVMTGASGNPVNTNFANMDDAFPASAPSTPTFSMTNTNEPTPTFTGDRVGSWDSTLQAFKSYLTINNQQYSPIFLFNNNQINSGDASNQNLHAWGQIWFEDTSGANPNLIYDFTNTPAGGAPGGDPTVYHDQFGINGIPTVDDYVLSGGALHVDDAGNVIPSGGTTLNHNLGANQAAYALASLQIDDFLVSAISNEYDAIHIRLYMTDLNNGYEQLFILPGTVEGTAATPEPGTMLLMGLGALGAAVSRRRMRKAS